MWIIGVIDIRKYFADKENAEGNASFLNKPKSRDLSIEIALVVVLLIFIATLVYSPHKENDYPLHIDEWRHISEARSIEAGDYDDRFTMLEAGFHYFLWGLWQFFDLVLIYKFLPAIFAVLAGLILFISIRDLTGEFWIAFFSLFFFAFLKSNINIGGLWFFTPLTFAIPFIYIYAWQYVKGIENGNQWNLLVSFAVMLLVLSVHPISVTFMLPVLFIYTLLRYSKAIVLWKTLTAALIVPIAGFIMLRAALPEAGLISLLDRLIFRYGWGVYEKELPLLIGYNVAGGLLAIAGIYFAYRKRHHLFILWTVFTASMLFFYGQFGFSVLAPYQRFYYYFLISLPVLSGFGMYLAYVNARSILLRWFSTSRVENIITLSIIIIMGISLMSYHNVSYDVQTYQVIGDDEYSMLKYMESIAPEGSNIVVPLSMSPAVYPVSGLRPIATVFFYGNSDDVNRFYDSDCDGQKDMIESFNLHYVVSEEPIDCGWARVGNLHAYIYEVN